MNQFIRTRFIFCIAVFMTACGNSTTEQGTTMAPARTATTTPSQPATITYKKGDPVASSLVCMVNDAFMGKPQIAVPLNGKTYYGCCEMCKNRIPQDAAVRTAKDPATGKPVDKASAYIVITGDKGEVSYFESAATYKKFVKN